MNITALEIRQKEFEKNFRGYDKDEVQAFLTSLATVWEKMTEENRELKIRLDNAEKEVKKLREVESSLFKTLKTAEDTGANMIEQATKSAELQIKEAQMKAESILFDAKENARNLTEKAETAVKKTLDEMEREIRELEKQYNKLEGFRDTLADELKNAAQDLMDKVSRIESKRNSVQHVRESVEKAKKNLIDELSPAPVKPKQAPPAHQEEKAENTPREEAVKEKKQQGSFFDDIE